MEVSLPEFHLSQYGFGILYVTAVRIRRLNIPNVCVTAVEFRNTSM
jgi:hypothetical protein